MEDTREGSTSAWVWKYFCAMVRGYMVEELCSKHPHGSRMNFFMASIMFAMGEVNLLTFKGDVERNKGKVQK